MQRSKTILHVDDDPEVLRVIAPQLEKMGYEVISITDPNQVMQKLLTTYARVVLLDIDMPGINGMQLLREIRAQDGGVQVIMLTGLVSMSTVLQTLRWGAEACLFKPVVDIAPLQEVLGATFTKIERWWNTLNDLQERKQDYPEKIESILI